MDFVKREDHSSFEENYKIYMDSLQKSHQIDTEYQHTPISMEQLHQAMQSSLNTSIVHNFQLPLSPRQMSTLMLKTNHLARNLNFNEIPAHLSRDDTHINDLSQNLRHEDVILSQSLGRNLDISLVRNELELQNNLSQTLAQNLNDHELVRNLDLSRINELSIQNLRTDLSHNLGHEINLSHHMTRQNLEQDLLNHEENRRTPIIITDNQSVEQRVNHYLDKLDQSVVQRLNHNLDRLEHAQRLNQNLDRADQNIAQRLNQNLDRLDQDLAQRFNQNVHRLEAQRLTQHLDRLTQNMDRLDPTLVQKQNQNLDRLDQRLVNANLALHERQIEQNDLIPMQFHIKSEQEDDGYFYDNVNQGLGVNTMDGQIHADHTQSTQTNIHADGQMYPVYNNHVTVPALNPIDLYSRPQSYIQNFVANNRDNPQNLVVPKQFDSMPYTQEELKKLRQDGDEDVAKKSEEPKENLKPSDQNKIFYEYNQNFNEKNENDSSVHNKMSVEELSVNIKGEYVCYKCNEVFPSKRGLKQHAKACAEDGENEKEKVGKFGCTQCAYRCQSPAILKIHERTHSGEKPFSCTICDYKSGQKNNVAKHILVHMKEKPFHCQYCEYRCAQKNNLVVHERTHTGYKPFACPYCDYRTVQKPNLVKHMYLHTDQKPFSCDMCSYRCVQKTNLTKHKQRHLNEKEGDKIEVKNQVKPYRPRQKSVKCNLCPYRCVQKSSMEKHMQFKHGGQHHDFEQGLNLMKNDEEIQNLSVKKEGVFIQQCQERSAEPVQIQA